MDSRPELTDETFDLFEHLGVPVWVFAFKTLRILKSNRAAEDWLGLDVRALQTMTIADLRPEDERAALIEKVRSFHDMRMDAGTWSILSPTGERLSAAFCWSKVTFEGTEAVLSTIRDETMVARAEARAERLRHDIDTLRKHVALTENQLRTVFDGVPGKMMVLTPDTFEIVAVTDEYAKAVMLDRDAMLGRGFLDVFPADPSEPDHDGHSFLRASLERVKALRSADIMNLQRYPVRRQDGSFEEKFWLPHNKPVFDPDGELQFIIHRVEDVTDLLGASEMQAEPAPQSQLAAVTSGAAAHVALQALQERDKRLATAERLLAIGTWEMDIATGALNWSDRVFDIYGVPKAHGAPVFEGYVALVHPDDREQMLSAYRDFHNSGSPQFLFEHRIIRQDGTLTHVRGVGARHVAEGREIVVGVVQDITRDKDVEEELRQTARRRELVGRLVRLGGWRICTTGSHVTWSEETAAIHDEPAGTSPTVEAAIDYYAPEYRDRIRASVDACMSAGTPFDEILELVTAKGRRVWVRTIGEPVRDALGQIVAVEGAFQDISDLMAAQDAVVAVSRRLHRMIENISDAFYILDSNWRFTFLNSRAEEFLDRSREALLGQEIWEVFPEAVAAMREQFEKSVSERQNVRFETRYSPSGAWYEIVADPTPEGLAVYFRDVTEQRARYEQLRLLEAAVSRTNDIFIITKAEPINGPDGPRIVYVNDAFTRRTGFTREEAIGATPRILQGPRTDRAELDRIRSALQEGQAVKAELINYTKTGEDYWLEMDIVPLADGSGKHTHLVAVERDITERKRSEEALKANEERFQLVTRAVGSAVWEWDVINDRDWWSEGFLEIFGHQPDDPNTPPIQWMSHIHPDDKPRVDASIARLLKGEIDFAHETYRFRRADGSWAFVDDRSIALRGNEGRVSRILGSMTDVSEKTLLEDRLRQAQKMEAVGQLTGGIAHDFNNLLTIILGNAEILSEDLEDNPALRRLAELTVGAAERGAELTSRLLSFSRKQVLAPKVVDPGRLLQELDGLLRRTLPENIDLEIIRSGGLWKAELDAGQLEAALLNLALNARDAMPGGGCLTLEASNASLDDEYIATEEGLKTGQYVLITVTDTGHGIPRDSLDRVFEPFFTTKQAGKGSGLGLSMVYGFVKQSGGHIRVYSEPGEGTSFKLYFPRALAAPERRQDAHEERHVGGGRETILVVEDEEMVREHVLSQLSSLGYHVIGAASGVEAHEMLRAGLRVNLLFTDVVMPGGMSGRDLAKAARHLDPRVRVLFTSGYTENSIVHNGKLDHGIELLSKPYRREQLAMKVRKVLDQD